MTLDARSLLIAYDGSSAAAVATRAAGVLFPGAGEQDPGAVGLAHRHGTAAERVAVTQARHESARARGGSLSGDGGHWPQCPSP